MGKRTADGPAEHPDQYRTTIEQNRIKREAPGQFAPGPNKTVLSRCWESVTGVVEDAIEGVCRRVRTTETVRRCRRNATAEQSGQAENRIRRH